MQSCPSPERWQAHLEGDLTTPEQAALTEHLESCAACQKTLETIAAGGDSLLEVAKQVGGQEHEGATEGNTPSKRDADVTQAEEAGATDALAFLAPPQRKGSLGRLDHYEVLEVLGKGGFGTVVKAFDEKLHRMVAIKILAPELAASGPAKRRFLREAKSAAAVKHDNVVSIYAVADESEVPYLVMECIEGQTLQGKLDKTGPLEVKEILRIGLQIAEGLAAAHKQGLVHRDIKPANILLENGVERVKITDFGLARAVDDASMTQSGTVAGTPMYMSPEQAEGLPIDHRSDLFSLGTVLYATCTGHPPFRATGTMAVLKRVIEETPRPIREINNEIPDWLCDIISKLHAKKPEERFQTAKEVAEALGQRLADVQAGRAIGEPSRVSDRVAASATPATRSLTRLGSPKRRRIMAASGILLIGVVVSAFFLVPGIGRHLSNQMSLKFHSNTPDARLIVSKGGEQVAVLSQSQEIALEPGMYAFEIEAPASLKIQGCTVTEYAWHGSWIGNVDLTQQVFEAIGLDEPRPLMPRLKGYNMVLARGRQVVFGVNAFPEAEAAVGPKPARASDRETELQRNALRGKWLILSGEANGEALPKEFLSAVSIAFDDAFELRIADFFESRNRIVLDGAASPRTIMSIPGVSSSISRGDADKVQVTAFSLLRRYYLNSEFRGIYELEGNQLKLCIAQGGYPTPKRFDSRTDDGAQFGALNLVLVRAPDERLQGKWDLVEAELQGTKTNVTGWIEFTGATGRSSLGGVVSEWGFKLNTSAQPKHIDFTSADGTPHPPSIYDLQGDTLIIAEGTTRPDSFKSQGRRVYRYVRVSER